MSKLDLKKEYEFYKLKKNKIEIINIPKLKYLMIDGQGDPNEEQYQLCMSALYSLSYTLKFELKKDNKDFTVMPLESLWHSDYANVKKEDWQWTAMILMPEYVTEFMIKDVIEKLKKKKDNSKLDLLKLKEYDEGLCIQLLHIGPFDDETETVNKMLEYMEENNYEINGIHHEIYFSDPRRVDPSDLKTIIRLPIKKKGK